MLENLVKSISNKDKKNFNKNNAKAFTILRQRIKKNNKQYQKEIEAFASNPVNSEEEESSEEESSSSSESEDEPIEIEKKKITKEVHSESEEQKIESDEESSGSESDTSTTSNISLTKEQETDRSKMTPAQRRVYWLKKVSDKQEDKTYTCKHEGCNRTFTNKRKFKFHQ